MSEKKMSINEFIKAATGLDCNQALATKICPMCKKPLGEFKDEISEREVRISGLCQKCQDEVFG